MRSAPSILCFGESLWDVWPDRRVPGGAPTNAALGLARLGTDVTLLSRVGADPLGQELLDYLAGQGLAIDAIQVDPDAPTGQVRVDVSDRLEVSYEICAPAAWDFITASRALRSEPDVIVYGSLAARHEVSRDSLLRILDGPGLRVFDVNLRPPFAERSIVEPLLDHADWVKVNEAELGLLCDWDEIPVDRSDPGRTIRRWARLHGIDTVCVTRGDRGAWSWRGDRLSEHPGYRVQVVDTIGCGDAFLARWLWETLRRSEPVAALARACALGALVATREGAAPDVDEAEIRALMARTA